ncbi:MAG: Fic family protein [Candidatus Aminicenantes bacterium]|nr:MAG: Fic family protein [Candidatus Aminicenantes bacterium]
MMTLKLLSEKLPAIPMSTSWLISDLAESKGKQELFTKQSPQKLKILREHAIIESAVSSNRIEGVTIDQKRVGTVIFGKPLLKDRNEEEVRGYRDVLNMIHTRGSKIPLSEDIIKRFHATIRGEIWDSGKYKVKDGDIIEKYPNGRERVRFRTVTAADTPAIMKKLIQHWDEALQESQIHPLLALAAFNLDFLCIHPFRDGNGRVSRLLLLLGCYKLGHEVGRYISLERLIEDNKERYYQTLEMSSQAWHEGKHDPWPYLNYLLFIMKTAYREFEDRAESLAAPRGAKTEMVLAAIASFYDFFTVSDLKRKCPTVSVDMIRKILKDLNKQGKLRCSGRGPKAQWEKTDLW